LGKITAVVRLSTYHSSCLSDDLYYVEKFESRAFTFKASEVSKSRKVQFLRQTSDWEEFAENRPPSCFSLLKVHVLEIPLKEGYSECILYFPAENCLVTSEFIQNNDFDRKKVYGMTLSQLKISKISQSMLTIAGFGGHLQTPKAYWSICNSQQEIFQFHGQLMDLEWDRIICHYGGPSLQSAKRIRKDFIKDWPSVAFGMNVQLSIT